MSSTWILYGICAVMLVTAIAAVLPTVLRAADDRPGDGERRERAARKAVSTALQAERQRLDEDLAQGRIDAGLYESMLADLRRRVLEEQDAALNAEETAGGPAKPLRLSRGTVAAGLVALVTGVSAGSYAFLGAPELMELSEAQRVLEGTASAESIESYLKGAPGDGRAWVLLAHRRIDAGDFAGASEAYRRARAASEKVARDPDVMLEFGAAILTAGDEAHFAEANRVLGEALAARPGDPKAERLALTGAVAVGEWERACTILREMIVHLPPDGAERLEAEQTLKLLERRAATESSAAQNP